MVVAGRSGGYHETARIKLFPLSRHCLISSFPPSLPWTSRRGRPTPRGTPGVDDGVGVGNGWVGKFHFIGPRNRCGIQSAATRRPSVRDQINEIIVLWPSPSLSPSVLRFLVLKSYCCQRPRLCVASSPHHGSTFARPTIPLQLNGVSGAGGGQERSLWHSHSAEMKRSAAGEFFLSPTPFMCVFARRVGLFIARTSPSPQNAG